MSTPRSQALEALWSAYSHVYDGLLHLAPYRALISSVVERLDLESDLSVLDLGCGTGNCLAEMLRTPRVVLTGVDASGAMLARAERKLRGDARLVRADALEYLSNCTPGTFDRISAINVLYAVRNRTAVWRACLRALQPNGRMVAVIPDRGGRMPIIREHLQTEAPSSLMRLDLLGVAFVDWIICALDGSADIAFPTRQQLEREIADSGGTVLACERCYGGAEAGVALMLTVTPTS